MPLDFDPSYPTSQASTTSASAQPQNPAVAVVIEEDIASGALRCVLEDTDLPHARARELAAFQSGGKVDIAQGGIYNPGSKRVVLQMMAVRQNRMVIRGAFRDRIRSGAQRQTGGTEPRHARDMRNLLERIRDRRNPLRITWDGEERQGVLEEALFDEESSHDIAYALTFFVAVPPDAPDPAALGKAAPTPSLEDLRAQMAADVAEQRAAALDMLVNAVVMQSISEGLGSVSAALDTLGTAAVAVDRATASSPQRMLAQVNAVQSACANVRQQISDLKTSGAYTLDNVRADAVMLDSSTDAYTQWWSFQTTTEMLMDQILDAMRTMRQQAVAELRQATRLYRVQPGDTLESIALTQLGSKARAPELGIRPDQLVPGKYVRIPEAA